MTYTGYLENMTGISSSNLHCGRKEIRITVINNNNDDDVRLPFLPILLLLSLFPLLPAADGGDGARDGGEREGNQRERARERELPFGFCCRCLSKGSHVRECNMTTES